MKWKKPTDVTISVLFIYRRISTCFGLTGPSSGEFTQMFIQPLVQWLYSSGRVLCMLCIQSTRPERYSHWTNSCVNSCVNSPEDGPVGPKHVEIRRYMNKIEIVTFMFAPCIFSIKILLLKSNKCTFLVTSTLNKIRVTIKRYNKNSNMFPFTQEPSSGSPPVHRKN
jgi:hypothetical protein